MDLSLETLAERLAALEREVAELRRLVAEQLAQKSLAELGASLLREAKASQPAISAAVAKAYAEMGITGEPVGVEKLREMMAACGIKPEDNIFSREIIAMREE
jgi:hypothetical protein